MFPPTEEHPLRVEFWGDTVEEIRYFKVADQRSLEIAEHGLWAPPCRELLLTDDGPGAGRARCATDHPELDDMLDKIAEGIAVEGMESLARCSSTRWSCCSTCCPGGTHVVVCDPERVRTRAARPGRDQPGVPGGVLGERGRRGARCRSTWRGRATVARRRPRARRARRTCRGGR